MSRAARSVLVFGLYMVGQGAVLMFAPNLLLGLFRIEPAHEVWVRVVGWCLVALGYYYARAATAENRPFFGWTVHVRLGQFFFFAVLALTQLAQPIVVGLAAVELASGLWTWFELRNAGASVAARQTNSQS